MLILFEPLGEESGPGVSPVSEEPPGFARYGRVSNACSVAEAISRRCGSRRRGARRMPPVRVAGCAHTDRSGLVERRPAGSSRRPSFVRSRAVQLPPPPTRATAAPPAESSSLRHPHLPMGPSVVASGKLGVDLSACESSRSKGDVWTHRMATTPDLNSWRSTRVSWMRSRRPASNVGPCPARTGCTRNSYSSISPRSANAGGASRHPRTGPRLAPA